jgi:hypothetical protein
MIKMWTSVGLGKVLEYESFSHRLFNSIWNKEEMPQQRKESIIIPTYKKNVKTDCINYRGISLLPTTYKILSNILGSRLTPYVGKIIGDYKCGC